MIRRIPSLLKTCALGAVMTLAAASAQAGIVFQDNFNANNFHTIWTVTAGNVDVGNYPDLCNLGAGGYCVDTEGTGYGTNASFQLATPIASLGAGSYTFSFDWGNNTGFGPYGNNILNWAISSDQGLLASNSLNSGSSADWTYENASWNFSLASAVTNAVIYFAQVGTANDWGGTVLDNVVLNQVSASVPEPATLFLMLGSLVGLGINRKRKISA